MCQALQEPELFLCPISHFPSIHRRRGKKSGSGAEPQVRSNPEFLFERDSRRSFNTQRAQPIKRFCLRSYPPAASTDAVGPQHIPSWCPRDVFVADGSSLNANGAPHRKLISVVPGAGDSNHPNVLRPIGQTCLVGLGQHDKSNPWGTTSSPTPGGMKDRLHRSTCDLLHL